MGGQFCDVAKMAMIFTRGFSQIYPQIQYQNKKKIA
jgi:hypothetical protein